MILKFIFEEHLYVVLVSLYCLHMYPPLLPPPPTPPPKPSLDLEIGFQQVSDVSQEDLKWAFELMKECVSEL